MADIGTLVMKIKADSDQFEKQMGGVNKVLGGVGKVVGVASAAVVGAGAGLLKMANDAAQATDRIDKMSQKLGFSRSAFQEWDFILSQNGASIDSLGAGIKTLTNQVDELGKGGKVATDAFSELGMSYDDLQGLTQEEIFEKTITALQGIEDEAKRAAIANDLLGRSGQELAPLLNAGTESINNMKKEAQDLGLIIGDDAVNAGVKLTDSMDAMKRSVGAIGTQIGAELLPVVQSMVEKFIDNLPKIKEIATNVFNTIKNAIGFVIDNINIIIPLLAGFTAAVIAMKVISTVVKIMNLWKASTFAQTIAQNGLNAALLANPIGLIVAAIGVLIAIGVALAMNWDKVKEMLTTAWEAIKNAFFTAVEFIKNIFTAWLDFVFSFWKSFFDIIVGVWTNIIKAISGFVKKIVESVSEKWQSMKETVSKVFNSVKETISGVFEKIKDVIGGIIDGIIGKIKGIIDWAKKAFDWVKNLFNKNKETNEAISATENRTKQPEQIFSSSSIGTNATSPTNTYLTNNVTINTTSPYEVNRAIEDFSEQEFLKLALGVS